MLCEEIEIKILDFQENQLSPAHRAMVETHLADCADCRLLARQLQQLDLPLSARIKDPVLSDDFDRRLQERIQALSTTLSEAQRVERRRQLQAEFEAGMERIGRGSFTLEGLSKLLARATLAAAVAWLAWWLTSQLTFHINDHGPGGLASSLLPWLAASTVFLALGLAEAFPRQWKSLRLW